MGVNMKMIQQMQTRLEKMQRELAETVVEGTAGGGDCHSPGDRRQGISRNLH